MTVKEIRELTGLSQRVFCSIYKIPKRTLEDWETNKHLPPEYVVYLLERVVKEDFGKDKKQERA